MGHEVIQPGLEGMVISAEKALCFPGSEDHAIKVEVTKKGDIQVEMSLSGTRRWYLCKESEFSELKPENDRKLPLAARLTDEKFRRQVRVLAYRPGKRITLLDRSGHKPNIIKGFRRGRLDQMIERYELAHAALNGRGVHAPEVIEYESHTQSLILGFQHGEPLQLAPETMDLFQMAGEALRAFQDFPSDSDETYFDAAEELGVIRTRARRLRDAGALLPPGFPESFDRLNAVHELLPEPQQGLAHRDLHDMQFLQQPSSLALMDFDLLTRADNTLDAANFLAHLVLRQMQGVRGATQRGIDLCGKKFLRGLDRAADAGFWRRLRYYQATTFTRLALVYQVRPRWAHLIGDLLQMSHRCLDDFDRIRES